MGKRQRLAAKEGHRPQVADADGVRPSSPGTGKTLPPVRDDVPPPPIFDQWLACLKFMVGWNDQRSCPADEVREALRRHLVDEGIESASANSRICDTVVPLFQDVKAIDKAVVT